MKKSMILLLFLELIISGKSDSDIDIDTDFIFKAKCEDNKAKTGSCFYSIYDTKKESYEYAIFDKCGKGKKCIEEGICVKYPEKIKNGKSCNYDKDCSSRSCINKKCVAAKEGEKCNGVGCEAGLTCYDDYKNDVRKCAKPAGEGTKPENTNCLEGLLIDNDGKCAKYGILDDGIELKSGFTQLCKSGLAHYNKNKYICDSIDTEPICEKGSVLKTKGKWKDGTEIDNGGDCLSKTDYNGVEKIYYRYSKLQSKLYGEFLEAYKDLDLDKINSKEGSFWLSGKVKEKYLLYENAPALEAAGIINSEGEVVDDKKCEYEFMIKHLHSSFIKLKTIIIAMIVLLF